MLGGAMGKGNGHFSLTLVFGTIAVLSVTSAHARDLESPQVSFQSVQAFDGMPAAKSEAVIAQASNGSMLTAAATQTPREELFGASDASKNKAFAVSGFYDFGLAYTFASPAHWSRAVNRIRVIGEGSSGGVKYKVGGQVNHSSVLRGL
jgi:hypothetical protein